MGRGCQEQGSPASAQATLQAWLVYALYLCLRKCLLAAALQFCKAAIEELAPPTWSSHSVSYFEGAYEEPWQLRARKPDISGVGCEAFPTAARSSWATQNPSFRGGFKLEGSQLQMVVRICCRFCSLSTVSMSCSRSAATKPTACRALGQYHARKKCLSTGSCCTDDSQNETPRTLHFL